jgi:hypothetical protein
MRLLSPGIAFFVAFYMALAMGPGDARAQADAGVVAVGRGESYPLSRSFLYLEDTDGKLTLDDVTKPSAQQMFKPVPQDGAGANFGITSSAIWLKVTLRAAPDAPTDWYLEIAYPPLD